MTVREFCMKETQVEELVVIRDYGYIVATVWIDVEDIFSLSDELSQREVESAEWGLISVTTEHGDKISVPCHYVDMK